MRGNYLILIALLLFTFLTLQCKKNPTPPPTPGYTNPNKLTWAVDTLAEPRAIQTMIQTIWGTASDNIYISGRGITSMTDRRWDGNIWLYSKIHVQQGGTITGAYNIAEIWGLDVNNIWAVGDFSDLNPSPPPNFIEWGMLLHYDGIEWRDLNLGKENPRLKGVWGRDSDEIWAVGDSGSYYLIKSDSIIHGKLDSDAQLLTVGGDQNDVFIMGLRWPATGNITNFCFQKIDSNWEKIAEYQNGDEPLFGVADIYSPLDGIIYSVGDGIFRWNNNSWIKDFDQVLAITAISGASENYIWAVGPGGVLLHWDGVVWNHISLPAGVPSDIELTDVWTDGYETFICGWAPNGQWAGGIDSYILRGK
ncbi:MAG: hypothetical protein DWQ10_08500 [Calditrichaeota bacterium]|nr:MAG: hypothetical protein DWQ10_08500 [Calditrichota bacterium]